MRALVLALLLPACAYHHRATIAPTVGVRHGTTTGGELTGEATVGDEDLLLVAGATGRIGHDVSGLALRAGFEVARAPRSLGGRLTATAGPMFTSGGVRFEARGAVALYRGLVKSGDPDEGRFERRTIGVELFTSSIGFGDNHELILGLGFTIGTYFGTKDAWR